MGWVVDHMLLDECSPAEEEEEEVNEWMAR
jgi:hypothetical protein